MWELIAFLFIGWYGVGMAAGLGLLWLKVARRKPQRSPSVELSAQHRGERTRSSHASDEQGWRPANSNPV